MLVLNGQAMEQAVDYIEMMDTVEQSYLLFEDGKFRSPDRLSASDGANTLLFMPCFGAGCFGTKHLTLFPGNPGQGLPYIDGIMILNDGQTGRILALLDGKMLTALRTGAAGGVGVRHFAPEKAETLGLIGTGTQGFWQVLYGCMARSIRTVYLYDQQFKDYNVFASRLTAMLKDRAPRFVVCGSARDLLSQSEIVMTATPAEEPVLPDDPSLLEGHTFISIGSYKPHMRELPESLWQVCPHVYTELPFACEESGDLSQPLASGALTPDRIRYIGRFLRGDYGPDVPAPGRTHCFKSVGMGLMDLQAALLLTQKAQAASLGQTIDF